MSEKTFLLTKFDISGIQDYIFATNRLKENAGASYQINRVFAEFLPDIIEEVCGVKENWFEKQELEILLNDGKKAEIVYIGGGNALVIFCDMSDYQEVCRKLAKRVVEHCQGLTLVSVYVGTDGGDSFDSDFQCLGKKLREAKECMIRQPVYSPLPVIEQDYLYSHPIAGVYRRNGQRPEYLTQMQIQKTSYRRADELDKRFVFFVGKEKKVSYALEMTELAKEPESDSFIAVIHLDGNGLGSRFEEISKINSYHVAVKKYRQESCRVEKLFQETYWEALLNTFREEVESGNVLPVRPLILDGDDFTCLCQASQARRFVKAFFEKLSAQQGCQEKRISACAGIAYVHNHFPFDLAYQQAEACCSRAKKRWYANHEAAACIMGFSLCYNQGKEQGREVYSCEQPRQVKHADCAGNDKEHYSLAELELVMDKLKDWPQNKIYCLRETYLRSLNDAAKCKEVEDKLSCRELDAALLVGKSKSDAISESDRKLILDAITFYEIERRREAQDGQVAVRNNIKK